MPWFGVRKKRGAWARAWRRIEHVCARRDAGDGIRAQRARVRRGAGWPRRARTSSLPRSPQSTRDSLRTDRGNRLISREPPFRPTSGPRASEVYGPRHFRREQRSAKPRVTRERDVLATDDLDASADHSLAAEARERRWTDDFPIVSTRRARAAVGPLSFADGDRRDPRDRLHAQRFVAWLGASIFEECLGHPQPSSHHNCLPG